MLFLTAASDRTRRSAKQFGSMVRAKTTLTLSDLNGYGNYCGFRGSGTPVDNIDRYGLGPSHDDLLLSEFEQMIHYIVSCIRDGWMAVSVISGRREVDNERLCAMELRLRLRRFRLERGSNSVR